MKHEAGGFVNSAAIPIDFGHGLVRVLIPGRMLCGLVSFHSDVSLYNLNETGCLFLPSTYTF